MNGNPGNGGKVGAESAPQQNNVNGRKAANGGWPKPLDAAAFYGVAGELVKRLDPHTEADPAAILFQTLTAFGNLIGRTAHYVVEEDMHYANLNVVLVGKTSKARKGTSWTRVSAVFEELDPLWRPTSGLSTGEGLIWAVRDPIGNEVGVDDKCLLAVEPEFARVLQAARRKENTLSPVLRQAWDSGDLRIRNKNSPVIATDAHISVIGHITKDELVRSLTETESAIRCAADQVRLMHKALTQMNVQLQHLIRDLTGVTGLAIIQSILEGQRDPLKLAALKDHRIKASRDIIARSLQGDWRTEHLFALRQSFETWQHYQAQITACDQQLQQHLATLEARVDLAAHPLPPPKSSHRTAQRNEPQFDLRTESYRVLGVDLTAVPSFQTPTVLGLLAELGPDFPAKFHSAKRFASWLGLSPDNRISGGKVLSASTRDINSRVAEALRLAAQSLWHAQNYFGDLYRRWKARLGTPKAITAMAHKLARILWHLLKFKQPFNPDVFRHQEEKMRRKKLARLQNSAAALGYRLVESQ